MYEVTVVYGIREGKIVWSRKESDDHSGQGEIDAAQCSERLSKDVSY